MLAFHKLGHLLTEQAQYHCINIIVVQVFTIYGHDNITPLVKEQDLMYWVGTIQAIDPHNPWYQNSEFIMKLYIFDL